VALQRLALGLDAEEPLDDPADHHECRTDEVANREARDVLPLRRVVDELAEQQRAADALDGRIDRVEERDAQRPGLEREISLAVRYAALAPADAKKKMTQPKIGVPEQGF